VKQTKELDELEGTDAFGEDGIDQSRHMLTHKYSTYPDKSLRNSQVIGRVEVRKENGKVTPKRRRERDKNGHVNGADHP
jgi:hypothetical protein